MLRGAFRPVTRSGTGKSVSILTAVTKDDSGAGRDVTREAVMRGLRGDAERGADVGVREILTEAAGADELVDAPRATRPALVTTTARASGRSGLILRSSATRNRARRTASL